MLQFKKLTLDDKNKFDKVIDLYNFESCEYSFTTLYLWREVCDIEYVEIDNAIIIKKKNFKGKYHFMQPLGYKADNLKKIIEEMNMYKAENKMDYLFGDIEGFFLDELKQCYKGDINIVEDRNNFDYIYPRNSLATLAGKKLHNKKNHYNQFVKNYKYVIEEMNEKTIKGCIQLAKNWLENAPFDIWLKYEYIGIKEILKNINTFNLKAMAVSVEGKIVAFAVGEQINDKVAIIHLEKADSNYKGVYAFINKMFVEKFFQEVEFINREQDLGHEGLIKAKQSYKPFEFTKKYLCY